MGIWTILNLILAACSTFVTWFPQAETKFIAENTAKGLRSVAAAAFYQALRANIIFYLPTAAALYFGGNFLAYHLFHSLTYAPSLRLLAFDAFSLGMIQVLTGALLGLHMFQDISVVSTVVGSIFRQILIISLLILLKNFIGLVIGWVISDVATAIIYIVLVVRVLGLPRFDFPIAKLFRYYSPLELANIVGFAQSWFDRALLLLFVSLSTLGIYNVALTAYFTSADVSGAMANMLFPALASIRDKTNDRSSLRNAVRLATKYACLTITPIDFILLATAKPALTLLVGLQYARGSLPLIILCAADALTAFGTAFGPALLAAGETNIILIVNSVCVTASFATAYTLLPVLGIVGAAIARDMAMIVSAVLCFLALRRKISLQIELTFVGKTFLAGTATAAVVTAIQLVEYSRFLLPIYCFIGAIVYLIMLRLLKLANAEDVDLLRRYLGKRLSPISSIISWIILPST